VSGYVKNGTPVGGTGAALPTASAAGELPVSDGAGSAYTATTAGDVLALGMVAALTGEPAGAALISDGAGDLDVTSADVSAMLAAANAAAARTALGVTAPTHTTGALSARAASPAVGDTHYASDFDVTLRCYVAGTWRVEGGDPLNTGVGPFGTTSRWTGQISGTAKGPVGGPGYSLAIGLHVTSLPGSTECALIHCGASNLAYGWVLGAANAAGTANAVYLQQAGINAGAKVELTGALLTTGSWALALSISASEIRWSVNGGAVSTVAISGTFTVSNGSAATIGGFAADNLSVTWGKLHWFQAWSSTLGDAALQAIAAEHATYLPGASGATPVGAWLAARSRRDAGYQEMVGSQGLLYAPTVPVGCGRSVSP
jgi:hypothetical protein